MEAEWSFQIFKGLLRDCFGPKYKSKVSSYMDNTTVLLCSRLNLGFNLNISNIRIRITLFYIASFWIFSKRMNNPNKYNNIIGCISSLQNGKKMCFFYFWAFFFSKRKFLGQWHFCFLVVIQWIQFLWQYVFVRFMFLKKPFSF